MAGHSHAKTIKYRKGGQDAKRSKNFTKIQREIFTAVKAFGAEEKFNPKLRLAKQKARFYNMPNDKVLDAIKRASNSGANSENYEECYYLISASGGAFVLVKCLTDNKNRSASDIRGIATRYGASMGEPSTINFLFKNLGIIKYKASLINFDVLFEKAIEVGAIDVLETEIITEEETTHKVVEVICDFRDFNSVKNLLEENFKEAEIATLEWRANNKINLNEEQLLRLEKMTDELEELDDTSDFYTNFS